MIATHFDEPTLPSQPLTIDGRAPGTVGRIILSPATFGRWRKIAIVVALLLHLGILAWLIYELPKDMPETPPPPLSVQVVQAPPKPPAPAPTAKPQEQAERKPDPIKQDLRVSGGDSDAKPGAPPAEEPPEKAAAPTVDATPEQAPEPVEAASALPLGGEAPPPKPKAQAAATPNPPKPTPPAKVSHVTAHARSDIDRPGEGGGNSYLNNLRDTILSNRQFPPEASALAGLGIRQSPQYSVLLDRQGRIVEMALMRSSGADILDKAGEAAIRRSAPFRPLPPDIIGNNDVVRISIAFPMTPT